MSGVQNTASWKRLEAHVEEVKGTHLRTLLQDADRCNSLVAEFDGISLDYARENVLPATMDMLFDLATEAGLEQKRADMGAGKHINSTEDRAVMHIALRAPKDEKIIVDGEDVVPGVHKVIDQINEFATRVRSGAWKGATGKNLTTVVCIGIGGSFLGPEFVFEALRTDPTAAPAAKGRTLKFLANVDPVDVSRALDGCDPESTLVIIVSKTFTTAETMLNARTVKKWLLDNIKGAEAAAIITQHMVAVSSAIPKAVDFGISAANVFGFWDCKLPPL